LEKSKAKFEIRKKTKAKCLNSEEKKPRRSTSKKNGKENEGEGQKKSWK